MGLVTLDVAVEWAIREAASHRRQADNEFLFNNKIRGTQHLMCAERLEVLVEALKTYEEQRIKTLEGLQAILDH